MLRKSKHLLGGKEVGRRSLPSLCDSRTNVKEKSLEFSEPVPPPSTFFLGMNVDPKRELNRERGVKTCIVLPLPL